MKAFIHLHGAKVEWRGTLSTINHTLAPNNRKIV